MQRINKAYKIDKLFSWKTLILSLAGLVINILLANLVITLKLPLYVDSVGTVLVAALAGPLPGMIVGFASNIINSITDPISMYYGILSVLIAVIAAKLSKSGKLRSIKGCLALSAIMVLIGGACGSVMTWFLYGGGIGGIGSAYAHFFAARGVPDFGAQLLADILIDIPDKIITMIPVYLFLHFYPKHLYDAFSLSYLYDRDPKETKKRIEENKYTHVNVRITLLIVVSSIIVSAISVLISFVYYQREIKAEYENVVNSTSLLISDVVDGDMVEEYLKKGESAPGYQDTQKLLETILEDTVEVEYVYVYQIQDDGCHVVFDVDTLDEAGDEPGDIIPFDVSMEAYIPGLLQGEGFQSVMTNDTYGWLISAYAPIVDSTGKVVAFGCADVSMEAYMNNMMVFVIRMISLLFGISLFISSFALWYATLHITGPINAIVDQSRKFSATPAEKWLASDAWKNRQPIHTKDEIEELYQTICGVQEDISMNVSRMLLVEQQLREAVEIEKKNKELSLEVQKADEESNLKSEFYSRMSHDMRTPMNGIMGLVDLSKDETHLDVLKDNIEKIGMSSQYLLALVNDTLDMSKIESKKMKLELEPVKLGSIYDDVKNMIFQTLRNKEITFQQNIQIQTADVFLLMDGVRVKQALMNLFSNAVKFTQNGGTIFLEVLEQKIDEKTNHYHVKIQDTGCGMTEDFIENRLFHPFEQEKNNITISSAGSGLGLSIVKNLVELMGGSIQVKSELGEGTAFELDLEFKVVDGGTEEKQQEIIDFEKMKGCRILLCEDHPLNAEIVIRLLKPKGVSIDHALDGEKGVAMFMEAKPGTYDMILMDVRMPVMDGIEATKHIRKSGREDAANIPIIAMTANAYAEDKEITRKAGMNEHLAKPISPEILYKTIIKYL